jgi:hypothetical protein
LATGQLVVQLVVMPSPIALSPLHAHSDTSVRLPMGQVRTKLAPAMQLARQRVHVVVVA